MPNLFSTGTLAGLLDVPIHRIQYLISKHDIPHLFVDGKTRVYDDAALETLRKLVGVEAVEFCGDVEFHLNHLNRGMKMALQEIGLLRDELAKLGQRVTALEARR